MFTDSKTSLGIQEEETWLRSGGKCEKEVITWLKVSNSFLYSTRKHSSMELTVPMEPLEDTGVANGPTMAHSRKTEKFRNYVLVG